MQTKSILSSIESPADLKERNLEELEELCAEIRRKIIQRTSGIGGNVSSNLGVVEAIVALHYVFNAPKDQIVFDTSHYTYCHKMLTGRAIAYEEGCFDLVSTYTAPEESPFDLFELGHTSTSISIAYGLACARDIMNGDEYVIPFIGDGSVSGGVALEGLHLAGDLRKFIIILNDNGYSISKCDGKFYDHLKSISKQDGDNIFNIFGYKYISVENGNDLSALVSAFEKAKDFGGSAVVHIHTQKGKGYDHAEENPENFHWQAPYDSLTAHSSIHKSKWHSEQIFADFFINKVLPEDPHAVCVCAGTPKYIGFDQTKREKVKDNFIDVGICEQSAVAVCAGLKKRGCNPIIGIEYSFLKRAYDQICQELAINKIGTTIVAFHSSVFGQKAKTHLGIGAIPMLTHIPDLYVYAPVSMDEFARLLDLAVFKRPESLIDKPIVILAPSIRMDSIKISPVRHLLAYKFSSYFQLSSKADSHKVAIIGVGDFFDLAYDVARHLNKDFGIDVKLVNPCLLSHFPYDVSYEFDPYELVVVLEPGIAEGGYGQRLAAILDKKILLRGISKTYRHFYDIDRILAESRLTEDLLVEDIIAELD
ncbi:MAG: 1-deoxy-D-xylulose-5-phosphate synthase [Muribaculaceae bacterium]|nr:1-deoxy-D-xylulose-5-phosphate synthase [Muribaculaceae bacterium]